MSSAQSNSDLASYPTSDWNEEELKHLEEARNSSGLRISAPLVEPWVSLSGPCDIHNVKNCQYGFGIELTKTICDRLRIGCTFLFHNVSANVDFEKEVVNGIMFSSYDTSLPMFGPNSNFLVNLNFTAATFFTEDGILLQTQYIYPSDHVFVLKPFRPLVWGLIILSLIVVVAMDGFCQVANSSSNRSIIRQFLHFAHTSCFYHVAALLQRNVDRSIAYWSRRFLIIGWGFSALLLGGAYSAMLVSSRVAPTALTEYTSLADVTKALLEKKLQLIVYNPDAMFVKQIQHEALGNYGDFHAALQIAPPEFSVNLTQAVNRVLKSSGKVALYASLFTLKSLAIVNCSVSVVPLGVKRWGAYAFRKNELIQYASLFTKVILNFQTQGYYVERLEDKFDNLRVCREKYKSNNTKEDIVDVDVLSLQLIFWALLFGYCAGGTVLMLEKIGVRCGSYYLQDTERNSRRFSRLSL